jgi:hypothetical protein
MYIYKYICIHRKFTDVYTAAACLEGTAVANLKLALYAADNKVSI